MRQQFLSLQVLRGVACLLVVVYHVASIERRYDLSFSPMRPFLWFGFAGVDLFFVLSGFIIASTNREFLGRPSKLPLYVFRRVWRIYPTYWAALAVALGVFAWLSPEPIPRDGWIREMIETVFLIPQEPVPRFLAVSWTLSYEVMFYLAFGVLFLLPRRAAWPMVLAWGAAVTAVAAMGFELETRYEKHALSPSVLEFLAGCVVAWCPVRLSSWPARAVGVAAIAWVAAGLALTWDAEPDRLTAIPLSRAAVFGVASALGILAYTGWERGGGEVRLRRLAKIGDASYSIYLLHITALIVTFYLSMLVEMKHSKMWHTVWIVMMLAAGIGPGYLFHLAIEAPLMRLGKRRRPARNAPSDDEHLPRLGDTHVRQAG